jgi:DNA polymerase III delta prime subunit
MLPLIISGGSEKTRKKVALEKAEESSSKFDTTILKAKENRGIDDIREIERNLFIKPYKGAFKSVIILEAQNLTIEAQNAFLKSLEEVPNQTSIILTTESSDNLLSTIVSRCERVDLPKETSDIDFESFREFLKLSTFQKYRNLNKLDLNEWLSIWREILLSLLSISNLPFTVEGDKRKVYRYIKMVNKLTALERKKASSKLLKSLAIVEIPPLVLGE